MSTIHRPVTGRPSLWREFIAALWEGFAGIGRSVR